VELAESAGLHGVLAPNGAVVDLTGDRAKVIDTVETGRLYLDGKPLIGAMDGVVRERVRMAIRGHAIVSVMFEADGRPADRPWVEILGLPDPRGDLAQRLETELDSALERSKRASLRDDEAVEKLVEKTLRVACEDAIGKKPVVTVMINRFE